MPAHFIPGGDPPPRAAGHSAVPLSPDQVVQVTLQVRRNPAGASSPLGTARLDRDEYRHLHGASDADLAAVASFAAAAGLDLLELRAAERLVILRGGARVVGDAFGTVLEQVREGDVAYRSHAGPVAVPDALAGVVTAVMGLHSHALPARPRPGLRPAVAASGAVTGPQGGLSPLQVAGLYDFPAGLDGKGQTVAVIELGGGYQASDLQAYFTALDLPVPTVVTAYGTNSFGTALSANNTEVALDIAIIGAMAPATRIALYFAIPPSGPAPTDSNWLPEAAAKAIAAAVHDASVKPDILSLSIAGPESGWTAMERKVIDDAFQEAQAMGVTVLAAAGDYGYTAGQTGTAGMAEYPASSPFATACGGTLLTVAGNAIVSEVVWNDLQVLGGSLADGGFVEGLATGGGISGLYPVPDYQADVKMPASLNAKPGPGRGLPDVAGNAAQESGYPLYVDGQWNVPIGGTSAVAPLWAALVARINQGLGRNIGDIGRLIYQHPSLQAALRPVLSGTNGADGGGYAAGPGWNACTGFGSPNGTALLTALKALGNP